LPRTIARKQPTFFGRARPRHAAELGIGNRWLPQTTCALRRMFRRSSAAVATSREGHRSVPGPALPLRGPSPANRWEGSHLHQKGSQKRSLGPHGRLVPAGLARPPTPVSKNRLKCGAVTASCLPPSLKIRIVVAHERTVLPSMPPLLMLPGPKSLKTVIVEAYVTLLEAHESSAAMRSSFGCILHLAPRSASISVIP
jgi:hypothetical protein